MLTYEQIKEGRESETENLGFIIIASDISEEYLKKIHDSDLRYITVYDRVRNREYVDIQKNLKTRYSSIVCVPRIHPIW